MQKSSATSPHTWALRSKSGRRKQSTLYTKPLPAEGNGKKCTPQSAFDHRWRRRHTAGKATYEPEKITAERLAKDVTQYQIQWVGRGLCSRLGTTINPSTHRFCVADACFLKRTRPRAERADGSLDSGFSAPDSHECPLGPCTKDTSKRKVGWTRHGLESKWVLAHILSE